MSLHDYEPPDDIISKYFKGYKDEEIPGYLHTLLESKYTKPSEVIADFKPYFESAHRDARAEFHDEIGINLHPDADPETGEPSISYPASLPTKAKRGLFGEAFSGLVTEVCNYIGGHSWKIPVFLFRFHSEAGAYLFTLRRNPAATREIHGRKGDDFIAICLDDHGSVVRVLSGEAKWRATLSQSIVDGLLLGKKDRKNPTGNLRHNGKGILNDFNKAVNPPPGLKQVQRILKQLDPDTFADAIFSIDEAVMALNSPIERTNLIVIAGNRNNTREPGDTFITHDAKPQGYTAANDLQVVEIVFNNGEEIIDGLYNVIFKQ